jgi:hypothetical protein
MSDEIPYLPYNQFASNEELEAILSKPVLKDWVSEIKVDDINRKFGIVLVHILEAWTVESTEELIRAIRLFLPVINKMISKYPNIFVLDTTKYSSVFRGTNLDSDKLEEFIKLTDIEKWKPVKLKNDVTIMVYFPKKFTYKPHRSMQSWSVNHKRAAEFGEAILIGRSKDSKFLMSPDYFHNISRQTDNEFETIHIGTKYKVWLGIEIQWFSDIVRRLKSK